MKYPPVELCYLETNEIVDKKGKPISNVLDYWKWAHSNLLDNAERGVFAEYLVACAIGGQQNQRINWEKYDLVSPEGITIEVKSSAYIQTWAQEKLSTIRFSISKSFGYNRESGTYEKDKKRQAQVYVFCVFNQTTQEGIDMLNTYNWDFYVLSSKALNQSTSYSNANSIGLSSILKLGACRCGFEEIYCTVVNIANQA